MIVSLVFPPQWTAAQPYAGLASLNGELLRAGHQVSVHDLNLRLFEYVLEPRTLGLSQRRLESELSSLHAQVKLLLHTDDRSDAVTHAGRKLEVLEEFAATRHPSADLAATAPSAHRAMRANALFYQPAVFCDAMATLDECFKVFTRPYWPAEVRWNDFHNPLVEYTLASMLAFCRDDVRNPFRHFYQTRLDGLLEGNPDLVALSIGSFSQVLPGLTLAHQLRQELHRRAVEGRNVPHLALGGNFFSRLLHELQEKPAFFEAFCDSVVVGEGEAPVVALAHACSPDGQLDKVPNLLWRDGVTIRWNGEAAPCSMKDAAVPNYDGFKLDRYLSPEPVACLAASKGCYYGACAFCDSHYGLTPDQLEPDALVERIRQLGRVHGIRHFEFIDQCISPEAMDKMCDAFVAASLDIAWFCNARTETGFTPRLLQKMKRAGCTMVMWGVETASPRLLKLMRKGVNPANRMQILKDASDAGLWNFAYIFFGFPTETEEEAMDTIRMLVDHQDIIHSYGRSVFTLGKHAPLFEDRKAFGILEYVEDRQEFSTNLTYRTSEGLQASDLAGISQRCRDAYAQAAGEPLWMLLRSRENLHLYLAHHGADYVRRWKRRQPATTPAAQPGFVF